MKKAKAILCGLLIITFGIIIGGNALGIFNINMFFSGWWTLFIIIPSIFGLITEKEKYSCLAFLIAGIVFLLASQNVFSFETAWTVILASVIILIGLSIIIKTAFKNSNDKEVEKKIKDNKDGDSMDIQTAIFSGNDRVYNNEEFTGADLTAIFGGVDLDLLKAKFTKDTVIKAYCLFGGISIRVPENVKVKVKSGYAFGGVSDERKQVSEKAKYTIYIDAAGGFGGISIEDKEK